MVDISSYMDPRLIVHLKAESREDAIRQMIDTLDATGKLLDKELFCKAILEREKLVSTGIGMSVALPHAKLTGYEDFFITIGIAPQGIEWPSLDRLPIRLIFLIGGPDSKQTEYLQILSHLTSLIKNEQIRKKMLTLNSAEDIIALFR